MKPSGGALPPAALIAVMSLMVVLLSISATTTSAAKSAEEPRKTALINRVMQERGAVDDLDLAVERLRGQVDSVQETLAKQSDTSRTFVENRKRAAVQAASVEMEGSGLVVTLADAPKASTSGDVSFGVNRIQDNDIQLVVNQLLLSRAEAIAINDNRVSSVTPIRAAGGTIVVNYRPVASPYRIVAIGADYEAFMKSDIAVRLSTWKSKYELGFSTEREKRLKVPAYSGRGEIGFAQVVN